jgi:predicted  nucleic acid-binding Zn-ribbon protein
MAERPSDDVRTQVAVNAERIRSLTQLIEGLAASARESNATVVEVAKLTAELATISREGREREERLRTEIAAAEQRFTAKADEATKACTSLASRLEAASGQRLVSRATIIVAAIGGGATILAATLPHLFGG